SIQGLTPGVLVLPESGMPGSSMKVRIRGVGTNGNSNPLYIVDGIKMGNISSISTSDIQSMEIMKDAASSAIYGAEGANGVIIITTKSGFKSEDGVGEINYSMSYGIQTVDKSHLPTTLNSSDYIQYQDELNVDNPNYTRLNPTGYDTDWMDYLFEAAPVVEHNISFAGGSEKSTYYTSVNYFSQDGIAGGDKAKFERLTARTNLSYDVKSWVKVSVNAQYSNSYRKTLVDQDEYSGLVASCLALDPLFPVAFEPGTENAETASLMTNSDYKMYYNDEGWVYGVSDQSLNESRNPENAFAIANGGTRENKLLASAALELTPFKGFKFTSRPSIDWNVSKNHYWSMLDSDNSGPTASHDDRHTYYQLMWENFATYQTTIEDDHNITATLGMSAEKSTYNELNTASGPLNVEDDLYNEHNYTGSENNDLNGFTDEDRMVSYFGRMLYDYKHKYMLSFTLRNDITSTAMVPEANMSGWFPSLSTGWNISEEDFFPKDNIVSFAKLRASWGQNGSINGISKRYAYNPVIVNTEQLVIPDGNGAESLVVSGEPSNLANAALTWETTVQTDIGFDVRMLDNKISMGFDWYNKTTEGLLLNPDVPSTAGNWSPYANAGNVQNTGVEFQVGFDNQSGDFSYGIHLNGSHNKNIVSELNVPQARINGSGAGGPSWLNATAFEEDEPIWYYRGYEGEIDANGDFQVVDTDGVDGISDADKTNIGNPWPDFTYGGDIFLAYKGFDFNMILQGQTGAQNILAWMRSDRLNMNVPQYFFDNRYTADNTSASLPKPTSDGNFYQSDFLVYDNDFLRIKQIQFGYNFNKSLLHQVKISNLRVYVSLKDFFTFTEYPGMDPVAGMGSNDGQGLDKGVYPTPRTVVFGLNLAF
ncbi:MAG: SusC/RagA family TonB-linked outer membrane protein, partial [Bacteroidales bacterium]|nr:SusC/RagA family TonB-linked outer membrane protein [Bacteroidales bacterium]